MEIHNVLYCHQRMTKPQPQVTCTENFVKFGHVVFTLLPVGVRSIAISVSVCLSVFRSHISKPQSKFQPIFCVLPVAMARSSSDGNAIGLRSVLSVLWMTSCFTKWSEWARIKGGAFLLSSSPRGGTGDEICCLRLHRVEICEQTDVQTKQTDRHIKRSTSHPCRRRSYHQLYHTINSPGAVTLVTAYDGVGAFSIGL